jgi:2-keto-4-pentenoate hydratase/2-oxohepta-3-ene-1,7-dioic acid hydratase in catechol pathway
MFGHPVAAIAELFAVPGEGDAFTDGEVLALAEAGGGLVKNGKFHLTMLPASAIQSRLQPATDRVIESKALQAGPAARVAYSRSHIANRRAFSSGNSNLRKSFMRLLTFHTGNHQPRLGVRVGDHVLDATVAAGIAGTPVARTMRTLLAAGEPGMQALRASVTAGSADRGRFATAWMPLASIHHLPPIMDADKFLCVGKNYRAHLEELKRTNLIKEMPEEPTAFVKLNSCLAGHNAKVVRPKGVVRLDYEPELVFVIGKHALGAGRDNALQYAAGVTILNDLTCRDLQLREVASGSRFWTAKNIPGFGPLGPEIITMDEIRDPYDLWMVCRVNGEERMRVNTRDQIWKFPDIISHFSRFIPLQPGDLFSTGAPGGVAVGKPNAEALFLKPGDVVECEIEGLATLSTTIVAPEAQS